MQHKQVLLFNPIGQYLNVSGMDPQFKSRLRIMKLNGTLLSLMDGGNLLSVGDIMPRYATKLQTELSTTLPITISTEQNIVLQLEPV